MDAIRLHDFRHYMATTLLAAGVDRRGGGKYAWKSLHRWGDVEEAYTYWAKKFAWRACMMRGEATCELPKE